MPIETCVHVENAIIPEGKGDLRGIFSFSTIRSGYVSRRDNGVDHADSKPVRQHETIEFFPENDRAISHFLRGYGSVCAADFSAHVTDRVISLSPSDE
jgi:hypothetical protein